MGSDDVNQLFQLAKHGDSLAFAKVESYVRSVNAKWERRFEVMRMRAELTGVGGVASYYCELKGHPKFRHERRNIERGIRSIEKAAAAGSWQHAVALYQFYGCLEETACHMPWGSNQELSGKWLSIAYKDGPRPEIDRVVFFEKLRSGNLDLKSNSYPHTPRGWKPGK